jgi:subfamily B ATP-binding cassette protein MsbA
MHSEWTTIKRALRGGFPYRWIIAIAIAANLTLAALVALLLKSAGGFIQLLGDASRTTADPGSLAQRFNDTAISLAMLAVPAALAAFCAWWFGQMVANRTMQDLRNRVLGHLVTLDLRFHQSLSRGDLLTRLTNDLGNMLRLQQLAYGKLLQKPVMSIGLIGALFWNDWRLASGLLLVLVPAGLIIWPLIRRSNSRSRTARQSMERNFGVLEQITAGIKVIKAMGSAEREIARYAESNSELVRANMRLAKTRGQSDAITHGSIFALAALGLFLCGWLFSHGLIAPQKLVTILAIIIMLVTELRESQRAWGDVQEVIPSAERVFELLDRPSDLTDRPDARPCPVPRTSIRLEGVRFRYAPDATEVLRGVDLEIPVGTTVALVGSSGGGKSTLIDLLPRFHDVTGGRIAWDGTDLRDFTMATIAPHCAIVGQEPFLFDGTVLDNLRYGRPEASQEQIEAAARRANLHDDVLRLEGGLGYNTLVGDRGGRLSGGQRQRVAIARALLRDAPILLLDEPTSALDAQSEQHVQAALAELMRGRTVVVVAHRLATVQHADRIYVLAGKDDPLPGTVLESGSHGELVARNGRYAELVRLQRLA